MINFILWLFKIVISFIKINNTELTIKIVLHYNINNVHEKIVSIKKYREGIHN